MLRQWWVVGKQGNVVLLVGGNEALQLLEEVLYENDVILVFSALLIRGLQHGDPAELRLADLPILFTESFMTGVL